MGGLHDLLQHLRRAPEPLKRRLRPLLVRLVVLLRAMPGGRLAGRAAQHLAPGLHAWVRRRFEYYHDAGLGRRAAPPADLGTADPDTRMVAAWLARPPAGGAA